MIVAGIGGIIVLALSQMSINQMKAMVYVEDRMSSLDFKNLISSYFLDEASCRLTLSTASGSAPSAISTIRDGNNQVLFSTSPPNNQFGPFLTISKMQLAPQNGRNIASNSQGIMNFMAELQRARANNGKATIYVEFPVQVRTGGGGNISTCVSPGGALPPVQATGGGGGGTGGSTCTDGLVRMNRSCNSSNLFNCSSQPRHLEQCRNGAWQLIMIINSP